MLFLSFSLSSSCLSVIMGCSIRVSRRTNRRVTGNNFEHTEAVQSPSTFSLVRVFSTTTVRSSKSLKWWVTLELIVFLKNMLWNHLSSSCLSLDPECVCDPISFKNALQNRRAWAKTKQRGDRFALHQCRLFRWSRGVGSSAFEIHIEHWPTSGERHMRDPAITNV